MSGADAAMIQQLAAALESRAEVLDAYLFGSTARGAAMAHSDVDVAVFIDRTVASSSSYGYEADLTSHLMSSLHTNRVDVVLLNQASPLLYHRVLRDGVRVLSRDLQASTVREGYALSRYCDYLPQLAKVEIALKARIRAGDFAR